MLLFFGCTSTGTLSDIDYYESLNVVVDETQLAECNQYSSQDRVDTCLKGKGVGYCFYLSEKNVSMLSPENVSKPSYIDVSHVDSCVFGYLRFMGYYNDSKNNDGRYMQLKLCNGLQNDLLKKSCFLSALNCDVFSKSSLKDACLRNREHLENSYYSGVFDGVDSIFVEKYFSDESSKLK